MPCMGNTFQGKLRTQNMIPLKVIEKHAET